MLPLNDTDFWWLRYGLGIALPIVFFISGICSLVSLHSYAVWRGMGGRGIQLIPVQGEQAILMGAAYLGIAMMLFANCYAQYHEKMGFYYERILGPGAILAGGGILWCSWIFLVR
jgi:hypothetical protein